MISSILRHSAESKVKLSPHRSTVSLKMSRLDALCYDISRCYAIYMRDGSDCEAVYCQRLWGFYFRNGFERALKSDDEALIVDFKELNKKREFPKENDTIYDVFADVLFLEMRITPEDKREFKKFMKHFRHYVNKSRVKPRPRLEFSKYEMR